MQLKALVSAIALGSALAFAGPAMAQVVINGITVPEDELPHVQARCDALAAEGGGSLSPASEPSMPETEDDDANGDGDVTEPDDAVDDNADAQNLDGVGAALTTTIDLEALTLEACQEAGLVN